MNKIELFNDKIDWYFTLTNQWFDSNFFNIFSIVVNITKCNYRWSCVTLSKLTTSNVSASFDVLSFDNVTHLHAKHRSMKGAAVKENKWCNKSITCRSRHKYE